MEGDIDTQAPTASRTITLTFDDAARTRELSGELAGNLKLVERALEVRIGQRGGEIRISGDDERAALAGSALQQLYALTGTGFNLHPTVIQHACQLLRQDPSARIGEYFNDVVFVGHRNRNVFPRSVNQRRYVHAMRDHDVVFGLGPAGTGKTYLAMATAVAALSRGEVSRIILCRPAVEAGEKLGFLPGDMTEKVNPYLRPLYDALHDMVDQNRAARFIERGVIEVAPLAFMRGRTLSEAYAILDEAQNTTAQQMKMFLTRLGGDSKAVITGDPSQIDLPRGQVSGLVQASRILRGVEGIGFVEFTSADVVRHSLVTRIIQAYERDARARSPGGEG